MRRNDTKRFVYLTLLCAMAITINILESTFIPPLAFGVRFGLANVIALITIELFSAKEMIIVNLMRVLIGNLLRGLFLGSTFWISLGGVTLSSIVLIVCKKIKLPLFSASMLSAIAHSLGQVMVVSFMYSQANMIAIVPILLISGIPTGLLTGFIATEALKRLDKNIKL